MNDGWWTITEEKKTEKEQKIPSASRCTKVK